MTAEQPDGKIALPADTNLIPWPTFVVKACIRFPAWGIGMLLAASLTGLVMGLVVKSAGQDELWIGAAISGALTVMILLAKPLDSSVTRPACVFLKDGAGGVYLDEQRWWRDAAIKVPDGIKFPEGRNRVAWMDAMDFKPAEDTVWPYSIIGIRFDPWLAPMPATITTSVRGEKVRHISSATVGGVDAAIRAAQRFARWRESDPRDSVRQGLMVAAIFGCLIALWMAGEKAMAWFGA